MSMTAGETLLKISDYPFAYSLVTLFGSIFGYSITQNHLMVIGIAGALGTLLTFTDPIGHLIRLQQKIHFQKNPMVEELYGGGNVIDKKYPINSLYTRSIGVEVDRILGIIYFGISAGLFILVLFNSHSFISNAVIHGTDQKVVCDSECIQFWGKIGGFVALGLSILFTYIRWLRDLTKKVKIAGIHQLAITDEYPTTNSVENMTSAVEQNDWKTADEWGKKILDEINHKKGKREIILRAGTNIYRPLHKEIATIEHQFNLMNEIKTYPLLSAETWTNIRITADDVIMEGDDDALRLELIGFYDLVSYYSVFIGRIRTMTDNIINTETKKLFGTRTKKIEYHLRVFGADNAPELISCALLGIHPKEYWPGAVPNYLLISWTNDNGNDENNNLVGPSNFNNFDEMWKNVLNQVGSDTNIQKFKKTKEELHMKCGVLKKRLRDKIALEWKV